MLIARKFPKLIAGRTKCPRGPYAGRVFEAPGIAESFYAISELFIFS